MSNESIGTVISDLETPSFETVRIILKTGQNVKPGTLVRITVSSGDVDCRLIARIRSAHEHNPNEGPEDIKVRNTIGLPSDYPLEEDSTIIYRIAEAELIEEMVDDTMQSPQTLPQSGAEVYIAEKDAIVKTLGLEDDESNGLKIGETVAGTSTDIILKREVIQRHLFLCGTTGSGKSYAMGVIAEEIYKHKLPIIFIDTQDEYGKLVKSLGGKEVIPGKDKFNIRISSLTESELINLLPAAMKQSDLQCDVVGKVFGELHTKKANQEISGFTLSDMLERIPDASTELAAKSGDATRLAGTVERRLRTLLYHNIFGDGLEVEEWCELIYPCLAINCKHLTATQLQAITTTILRELQELRRDGLIPPYVAVIDEAHLFVPEGEGSPCKQIIREGVRIGRHHGIAMVLMTQSPVDIDKRAIRQCNTRLVFALEPDQLDAIRGVRADASEEMLRSLSKMPQGTCLLSGTYESVKHSIPVNIRERETLDSEGGSTPDIFNEMKEHWLDEEDNLKQGEDNDA